LASQCSVAEDDRKWIQDAFQNWGVASREYLQLTDHPLPHIITFDAHCSYSLAPRAGRAWVWAVRAHDGQIVLPGGSTVPAVPSAFQAATNGQESFVLMSLPSIWRAVAPQSEIRLEHFLEGVLFHELVHSYQSVFTPSISLRALQTRHPFLESLSDDSLQEEFQNDTAYLMAFELERDLFFKAAVAEADNEARALSCHALGKLRDRRARHLSGKRAHWAEVDEISLTMEGLSQWTAYSWLTSGRGIPPATALAKLRSPSWSQDEGLAIFLLIDRLVPDWQQRIFAASPAGAQQLLAITCRGLPENGGIEPLPIR
jgi:hypothetical protein